MTELFGPSEAEQKREEAEREKEEWGRNLSVRVFFSLVLGGAAALLAHALTPGQGWRVYLGLAVAVGGYYGAWLFGSKLKRVF